MDSLLNAKAFFFDLFGTLFLFPDYDHANQLWFDSFYDLVGKPKGISRADVCTVCAEILETRLKKDEATQLTTYEIKIRDTFEKYGIAIPPVDLREIADKTMEAWQNGACLADDALYVLEDLGKRAKIVLITNFDHSPHVRKLMNNSGLTGLFHLVIISDEVGCLKPQPEIFELALRKVNLKAQDVVHVGDSVHDDVGGAMSVGIIPILIDRNLKSRTDYAQQKLNLSQELRTIGSLSELL
jgi:putative hydrolase of the HAD superfamily